MEEITVEQYLALLRETEPLRMKAEQLRILKNLIRKESFMKSDLEKVVEAMEEEANNE